jgi:hypothetical protein
MLDWQRDELEAIDHAENFYIHARLDAYEKDHRIFSDNWDETIKRDLV